MTNEELKKKICKIIADNYLPKEMPDRLEDYKLYRFARAADALIAAGLAFDKSHLATFQMLDTKWRVEKQRKEVAERAFSILWNECQEKLGRDINPPKYYRQQAERELAEEEKDD